MYVYTHTHTMCVCVCVYVRMYVCVYTHTHVCVCIRSRGDSNDTIQKIQDSMLVKHELSSFAQIQESFHMRDTI